MTNPDNADAFAERPADEKLAATMIRQILALEAQGCSLREGWRDVRPMTLSYLNAVLTGAQDRIIARE